MRGEIEEGGKGREREINKEGKRHEKRGGREECFGD